MDCKCAERISAYITSPKKIIVLFCEKFSREYLIAVVKKYNFCMLWVDNESQNAVMCVCFLINKCLYSGLILLVCCCLLNFWIISGVFLLGRQSITFVFRKSCRVAQWLEGMVDQ